MNKLPTHSLFFYAGGKTVTRLQGNASCSLLCVDNIALAEHDAGLGNDATVLCSDITGSIRGTQQATTTHSHAYTPYGFCAGLHSLLGFNGEYFDTVISDYLLGSYRVYNS